MPTSKELTLLAYIVEQWLWADENDRQYQDPDLVDQAWKLILERAGSVEYRGTEGA